jgi:hypothetical protein
MPRVASQLPFRSAVLHVKLTHRLVPTVHIAETVNYIVYVRVSCSHCDCLCTVRNAEYICYKKCRNFRRTFSFLSVPDRAVYKYMIMIRTARSILDQSCRRYLLTVGKLHDIFAMLETKRKVIVLGTMVILKKAFSI